MHAPAPVVRLCARTCTACCAARCGLCAGGARAAARTEKHMTPPPWASRVLHSACVRVGETDALEWLLCTKVGYVAIACLAWSGPARRGPAWPASARARSGVRVCVRAFVRVRAGACCVCVCVHVRGWRQPTAVTQLYVAYIIAERIYIHAMCTSRRM